jgi:hypothetical protein
LKVNYDGYSISKLKSDHKVMGNLSAKIYEYNLRIKHKNELKKPIGAAISQNPDSYIRDSFECALICVIDRRKRIYDGLVYQADITSIVQNLLKLHNIRVVKSGPYGYYLYHEDDNEAYDRIILLKKCYELYKNDLPHFLIGKLLFYQEKDIEYFYHHINKMDQLEKDKQFAYDFFIKNGLLS